MNKAAIILLIVGFLQMTGDILGLSALREIGAATVASPAPKVLSATRGLETYSSRFFLEWTDRQGQAHSLALTPEIYSRLAGPYNRRNVYGAALAYGPVLSTDPRTQSMFQAVIRYALCSGAPMLNELGINPIDVADNVRVRLEPIAGTPADLPRILEPSCQ
jgi:hypothetical protein